MGANIDTGGGDKRNVNVDINIVPFIDLMSCLTAFLLVTAVWINIAQINISPKGKNRDQQIKEDDRPVLSVLVSEERIYIGATRVTGDDATKTVERAANKTPEAVWDEFEKDLKTIRSEYFMDGGPGGGPRTDIEIAAESHDQHVVHYQDLISAMDHAIKVGFTDVGLTDPAGLSWRPTL
jgi:biopolymer transport protein ExbD